MHRPIELWLRLRTPNFMVDQRITPKFPPWLVVVLFGYCCMLNAESAPHFRATETSLSHLSTKILLTPTDRSLQSRRNWVACDVVTVQFSGLRSNTYPNAVYSVYVDSASNHVLIGQLNFFGTSRLKGAGRNVSFQFDKKQLGLTPDVGYAMPFVLRVVSNKRAVEGSNPIFSQVTAWCAAT